MHHESAGPLRHGAVGDEEAWFGKTVVKCPKVAIVGGSAAGLFTAYHLAHNGHADAGI